MNKYYYYGKIDLKEMPKIIKKAYNVWRGQRGRCYNKKHHSYKYWGKKGIKVEYSSREFIGWYLENIKKYKGKSPSIGRIDHSKNYSFNNIIIESIQDNSKKVAFGKIKYKIKITNIKNNNIYIANGIVEASSYTKIDNGTISRLIRKKQKRRKPIYKLEIIGG